MHMRRRYIRRGRRRIRVGEGLTHSQAFRRAYPQIGKVDTLYDIKELIDAIKKDKIPLKKKAKRLHYLYAITYSPSFIEGFKGSKEDLSTARKLIKNAWIDTRQAIAEIEYGD